MGSKRRKHTYLLSHLYFPIDKLCTQMGKVFLFFVNWTFCCPVLGSRHCTHSCIYWKSWPSPPAYIASLNGGIYRHGTVRQGSLRFNLREEASVPFLYPSCCIIYLCIQYFAFCCRGLDFRPRTSSTASSENSFRVRSSRWNNRTVRKVLADFAVCDWWRFCNALCDVKFRHIL